MCQINQVVQIQGHCVDCPQGLTHDVAIRACVAPEIKSCGDREYKIFDSMDEHTFSCNPCPDFTRPENNVCENECLPHQIVTINGDCA